MNEHPPQTDGKSKSKTKLESISLTSLQIAAGSIAVSFMGWILDQESFFRAWLFAWFFWFSIAIGCLGFFMIYRLTGGGWGISIERILLSGSKTIEILLLLFLPVFGGINSLYRWSNLGIHADGASSDQTLIHKHAYLNIPFWCARTLFYFVGLYALTWILTRSEKEPARRWSAAGLILMFLIVTFASIDWIMSLEAHWYSTVYGMMVLAGQGICGMAFPLFMLYFLQKLLDWNPPLTGQVLKDLGNLQLTTCILWTYTAFAQWLIIWIGNIPETVTWYTARAGSAWSAMAWVVVIAQFGIPFQLLLFQRFKWQIKNLAGLGLFLLIAHWLDLYWMILPAFHPQTFTLNWMVVPATGATGGLWFFYFLLQLRTLVPRSVESELTYPLKEVLNRG